MKIKTTSTAFFSILSSFNSVDITLNCSIMLLLYTCVIGREKKKYLSRNRELPNEKPSGS